MPNATAQTLVEFLQGVLVQAQQRAAGQVEDILDQIESDAEAGWKALTDLVESKPDWSTLLLLILTKVRDLDPAHITVGTMTHPQWKRLLTLTYHDDGDAEASVLLGLALTEADAAHGILLRITGSVDKPLGQENGLHVRITSDGGDVSWEIPFGAAMQLQRQESVVDVEVSWPPPVTPGGAGAPITIGPLSLRAHLDTTKPSYRTSFGLGDGEHPGVNADLNFASALGFLSEIVAIAPITNSYSPNVLLASGQSPSFSLAYRGNDMKEG
jgi:hypothetical protein